MNDHQMRRWFWLGAIAFCALVWTFALLALRDLYLAVTS